MSKDQSRIDALADVRALLADLERAEKALAALAQQAKESEAQHLFEFWWEAHMPQATQSEAWAAWQSAQSSNGVGVDAPEPVDELPDLNPEDVVVDVVLKHLGGFAPVTAHGVRVTHKPSRISVVVDSERSQHRNRQLALEALRAIIRPQDHPVPAPSPQAPGRRKGPPGITLEPQGHEQPAVPVVSGWSIDDHRDGSVTIETPEGRIISLHRSGGSGMESTAYSLALLAMRPADHPDTLRCITARNDLNAALHGEGAIIDDLEHAVANACAKLRRPAVEPMTPFTPSQRMRLWQNTEKGKSATSLGAFERICQTVEAAHRIGITAKAEDAHQPTKEAEKP